MKTKQLFATALFTLATTFSFAAILTVDNNPTSNAQYSTIPAAISAANDFDTLLVQPSAASYGSFSINKPLALIGRGHNATFGRATVSYIGIQASDVTIEGMEVLPSGLYVLSQSNIIIRNCRISLLSIMSNSNNILVSGNVINSFSAVNQPSNNILVLNNIFNGVSGFVGNSETIIFKNNIIRGNGGQFGAGSSLATFTDNIFFHSDPSLFNPELCAGCSFQNNLTYSPAGIMAELPNTVLNNVAPTWDLNGLSSPAFDYSINYAMLSGAPATGASDGGQVGIYGAGFEFDMNGFPLGVPRVTFTQIANPVVFPDGEIEVDFEAEAGSN